MTAGIGRAEAGMPIRWRLAGATFVAVAVVLALGLGVLAVREERELREDVVADAVVMGRLVAEHSAGDVAFGDTGASAQLLAQLSVDTRLQCAAVYDAGGRIFSSYCADGDGPPPAVIEPPAPAEQVSAEDRRVVATTPVAYKGDRYGTVVVSLTTAEAVAKADVLRLTVLVLGSGLALGGVALALALNRAVFGPIVRLAEVGRDISARHDWGARAQVGGGREVDTLARSINTMLAAVQEEEAGRDEAQRDQRRYLERLRALRAIDRAILDARPPRVVADLVADRLLAVTGCAWVGVVERTPAGPEVLAVGAADGVEVDRDRLRDRDCASNHACQDGSELCLQLRALGEPLGHLVVAVAPGRRIADDDARFVREVADLLAVSLRQTRLADALERHTDELEHTVESRTRALTDTVRELETFGYSVAHDLRAPLRAVQGYASLARAECGARMTDHCRDYLGRIVAASERMDHLIVDLLEYSRLGREPIEAAPVQLDEVVADALSILGTAVEDRGARITVERPLPSVLGSGTALVQVFANLLDNATKFARPGEPPVVRVRAEQASPYVRVWVEDNGIGIEPEHRGRIFGVFQRLHRDEVYPGTGIGLAIVKRAVERMGGHVGLESTPGVGSRFWVELRAPPAEGT